MNARIPAFISRPLLLRLALAIFSTAVPSLTTPVALAQLPPSVLQPFPKGQMVTPTRATWLYGGDAAYVIANPGDALEVASFRAVDKRLFVLYTAKNGQTVLLNAPSELFTKMAVAPRKAPQIAVATPPPTPRKEPAPLAKLEVPEKPGSGKSLPESAKPAEPPPIPLATVVPPVPSLEPLEPATPRSTPDVRVESHVYVVRTDKGSGSAFAAQMNDRVYLFTNFHVLAGATSAEFIGLGKTLKLSPSTLIDVATDRDLVRITLTEGLGLALRADPPIETPIRVFGNPAGKDVISMESGILLGLGTKELEVSADFIPGNSGGPIVDKEGKVIGVATYIVGTLGLDEWVTRKTRFDKARRFGVRLSESQKWSTVAWSKFIKDASVLETVEQFADESKDLAYNLMMDPYKARITSKVEWAEQLGRLKFRETYRGQLATYNGGVNSVAKTNGQTMYDFELERTNKTFKGKIRGQLTNLGNCLQSASTELNRLQYTFASEYAKSKFEEAAKGINDFGTMLVARANDVKIDRLFGF